MSAVTERSLPHNLDAERAFLGSILLDNDALNVVSGTVSANDLFAESHRLIFQKIISLFEKSQTVDVVSLAEELTKAGVLEKAGGVAYLAALSDGVPVGDYSFVGNYARIIKEKSILRRLINASSNVISRALEASEDAEVLIDDAQKQIFEIASEKTQSGFFGVKEIVKSSFGTIDVLFDRGQRVTGVETGFTDLDSKTSGLQPGELIVVAARPSMGKTALAMNIAAYAATHGKVVGMFSLEMSKESLLIRLLCSEARVDSHKLRTGFSSREDWGKMSNALGRLAEAPLFIEDTPSLSVLQMRGKARQLKSERGLDLLVIDYLQLATGHGRFENRTQEVSYISRGLKAIAKELHIPVVALSQLSRAPEQHGGGEPQLHHLRESGSIEQDADVVIFIHREKREVSEGEEFDPGAGFEAKLIIGKQRNGPTGNVNVVFQRRFVRFENGPLEGEPEGQGY
ncbi:MAG TPA: replicative DNA helicase [Terriglobia bacterium]|nr:replicative DNA helicase [Terriglobia bacterium]